LIQNSWFNNGMLGVIIVNTVVIALQTDGSVLAAIGTRTDVKFRHHSFSLTSFANSFWSQATTWL
jgi:hypothetical protein